MAAYQSVLSISYLRYSSYISTVMNLYHVEEKSTNVFAKILIDRFPLNERIFRNRTDGRSSTGFVVSRPINAIIRGFVQSEPTVSACVGAAHRSERIAINGSRAVSQ